MILIQNSIVHRNLKPQNILFDKEKTPKIGDCGFSRIWPISKEPKPVCPVFIESFQTYHYVAPEIMEQKLIIGNNFISLIYLLLVLLNP